MSKKNFHRWHKWLGLGFCFFLLMFAVSGIMLNHRHMYGNVNISRGCLPEGYHFNNWNNGLLRGTLRLDDNRILVYGAGGMYITDNKGSQFTDYNAGISKSADSRAIRRVAKTASGELFACSPFDTYQLKDGKWNRLKIGNYDSKVHPTRFSDVTSKGDTVVFVGRDALYVGVAPYKEFTCTQLQKPAGYKRSVTLFRTLWLIHSGEILGIPGKVFMDLMAILLIFFCCSGIAIWLLPKLIKRDKCKALAQRVFKWNFLWHNRMGRFTIVLLIFITLTGFSLRPPLLIALVKTSTPPIPGTALDTPNPWQDKLRALRWDEQHNDWLLSSSEGFFSMADFKSEPKPETKAPVVSVMGVNVLEKTKSGQWLVGSFSGLYSWDRATNMAVDCTTGEPAPTTAGAPFGKMAVSGYSSDFSKDVVCTYTDGTDALKQPEWMTDLPMSAWQLALEVHTGRIYTVLGPLTLVYIFFAGLLTFGILWTGWKIRKRRKQAEKKE